MKPLSSPADLSATILRMTGGTGTSTTFSDMEFAIKARDEEIIAWAEAEKENTVTGPNGWPRMALLDRLIDSLRGAAPDPEAIKEEAWIGQTVEAYRKRSCDMDFRDEPEELRKILRDRLPALRRSEHVR